MSSNKAEDRAQPQVDRIMKGFIHNEARVPTAVPFVEENDTFPE